MSRSRAPVQSSFQDVLRQLGAPEGYDDLNPQLLGDRVIPTFDLSAYERENGVLVQKPVSVDGSVDVNEPLNTSSYPRRNGTSESTADVTSVSPGSDGASTMFSAFSDTTFVLEALYVQLNVAGTVNGGETIAYDIQIQEDGTKNIYERWQDVITLDADRVSYQFPLPTQRLNRAVLYETGLRVFVENGLASDNSIGASANAILGDIL